MREHIQHTALHRRIRRHALQILRQSHRITARIHHTVTAKLDKVSVKAEVVDSAKGPKISIIKYKNKSGYRKRQGHRQKMSVVKITEIA